MYGGARTPAVPLRLTDRCSYNSIIKDYFNNDADYDELISCLYEYLMEDDAYRLDTFRGNDNSEAIYGWLRRTARNYFNEKKTGNKW